VVVTCDAMNCWLLPFAATRVRVRLGSIFGGVGGVLTERLGAAPAPLVILLSGGGTRPTRARSALAEGRPFRLADMSAASDVEQRQERSHQPHREAAGMRLARGGP
jgi:hypothetical protein